MIHRPFTSSPLAVRSSLAWLGHRLGIAPARSQVSPAERDCLGRLARGRRSLIEVGVYHGVSTALLARVMAPDGVLVAIDPHPPGRLGVSFERMVAQREVARGRPAGRVQWLRLTSHEAAATWGGRADFIFLDGDHAWAAIASDWTDWSPRLLPGGVILLHDSRSVPWRPDHDTVRFTNEVVANDGRVRHLESVESLSAWERRGD